LDRNLGFGYCIFYLMRSLIAFGAPDSLFTERKKAVFRSFDFLTIFMAQWGLSHKDVDVIQEHYYFEKKNKGKYSNCEEQIFRLLTHIGGDQSKIELFIRQILAITALFSPKLLTKEQLELNKQLRKAFGLNISEWQDYSEQGWELATALNFCGERKRI